MAGARRPYERRSASMRRPGQPDRAKGNALAAAGWTLLRFTHDDVARRPRETAATIAAQLSRAA